MSIKAVLFDLDGTLLPMDQDEFVKAYFKGLAAKLSNRGYDQKQLIDAVWAGTVAMIKNTSDKPNEKVFWELFSGIFGQDVLEDEPYFDEFYRTDFQKVQSVCSFEPLAADLVHKLKNKGYIVALATNPLFPAIATESRIRWAGLSPEDFKIYTTYENINRSKPHPEYYLQVAKQLGLAPEECLMVGNDVEDDMVAEKVGMKVFLVTDNLINKKNADISSYPHGSFSQLVEFFDKMN